MTTVVMLAPLTKQTYVPRSGTNYTSDANGVIHSVAIGDVLDLVADGLVVLTTGGRNNFTATTNPAVTDDSSADYAVGSAWVNTSTGALFIATSVALGAAAWSAQNVAGHPDLPWVTGGFYDLPPGATQAAVLTVLGTIYAVPFFIPNSVTLDKINVSVTTGQVGGLARGALFYDNAGYPGAIVPGSDTGDLDATGTAVVASPALALALAPGWYWFASIYKATVTQPSVIGATATYSNANNAKIGAGSASDALATASKVSTGYSKTGQTYPAVDMATSFPTFPAAASRAVNVTTPIAALGV